MEGGGANGPAAAVDRLTFAGRLFVRKILQTGMDRGLGRAFLILFDYIDLANRHIVRLLLLTSNLPPPHLDRPLNLQCFDLAPHLRAVRPHPLHRPLTIRHAPTHQILLDTAQLAGFFLPFGELFFSQNLLHLL